MMQHARQAVAQSHAAGKAVITVHRCFQIDPSLLVQAVIHIAECRLTLAARQPVKGIALFKAGQRLATVLGLKLAGARAST